MQHDDQHITFHITDRMDEEAPVSLTLGDEWIAQFADLPDPESDGPVCGMGSCAETATHVALDIDGETKIPVCEVDSYNTRFWGVWPIEEDSQFGDAVGNWEQELDSVPPGTNRAKPDWTGRVESPIVWAEHQARWGARGRDYLVAVVNEVARMHRRNELRLFQDRIQEITNLRRENLISESYRDKMIIEACDAREPVSLAKA